MIRKAWFSSLFVWVSLGLLLQAQTCERGDTYLLSLSLVVDGEEQIQGFNINNRTGYSVTTTGATGTLTVETRMEDSNATYQWIVDGTTIEAQTIGVGGGTVEVTIPSGQSRLFIGVRAAEGNADGYTIDVDRTNPCEGQPDGTTCDFSTRDDGVCLGGVCEELIDPDPVSATLPMWCQFLNGLNYVSSPTTFELTVDPLSQPAAGDVFAVEVSGIADLGDQVASSLSGLIPETPSFRFAVLGGADGTRVVPTSGAEGSPVALRPGGEFTCTLDAAGGTAGPFPSCDPANDVGTRASGFESIANTDCVPSSVDNQCLPYKQATRIEGTNDACASCNAINDIASLVCAGVGSCAITDDPLVPLRASRGSYFAAGASAAVFGYEAFEGVFPPSAGNASSIVWWIQIPSSLTAIPLFALGCWMGILEETGFDVTPPIGVEEEDLVSIPIATCLPTDVCGDGVKAACEECDDGNAIPGDGCEPDCTVDFCASDPIDCSATAECLTNPRCNRFCVPGTGCPRCIGLPLADGTACDSGAGLCEAGVCEPNWCVVAPISCEGTAECLTDGVCDGRCEPGTGCDRCLGLDDPEPNGTLCAEGAGRCQSATCVPGTWTPTELASTANAGSVRIGTDAQGNAIVVYTDVDGNDSNLMAVRSTDANVWSAPTSLESLPEDAANPDIAVRPDGSAIVVWRQIKPDGSGRGNIWSNRYTPSTGWGTAERINAAVGSGGDPRVVVDASGAATATWSGNSDGSGITTIISNRFEPGTGWGNPVVVEPQELDFANGALLVVDSMGVATAIWNRAGAGRSGVRSSRYVPGVGWEVPVTIDGDPLERTRPLALVVDSTDRVTAMWDRDVGSLRDIYSTRFLPGTGWGSPEPAGTSDDLTLSLAATVDSTGNVTIVWGSNGLGVRGNRYTPGVGWASSTTIREANSSVFPLDFRAATDSNDQVTVVWTELVGCGGVDTTQYIPGVGWYVTETLSFCGSSPDLSDTQIAVWQDNGVVARRFR